MIFCTWVSLIVIEISIRRFRLCDRTGSDRWGGILKTGSCKIFPVFSFKSRVLFHHHIDDCIGTLTGQVVIFPVITINVGMAFNIDEIDIIPYTCIVENFSKATAKRLNRASPSFEITSFVFSKQRLLLMIRFALLSISTRGFPSGVVEVPISDSIDSFTCFNIFSLNTEIFYSLALSWTIPVTVGNNFPVPSFRWKWQVLFFPAPLQLAAFPLHCVSYG